MASTTTTTLPDPADMDYIPTVNLSLAEVRQCLREIRTTPNVTHRHLMQNGMTVGQFCLWYLLRNDARFKCR